MAWHNNSVCWVAVTSARASSCRKAESFFIGRNMGTNTRLKDPQVAMLHCHVVLRGDKAILTDRGSSGRTSFRASRFHGTGDPAR